MPTANIVMYDEVNCTIGGLDAAHVKHFWEAYGLKAENFFFNPKYKLGSWDGKIRYFHTTGKTYVYLLTEILPKLIQLGYEINVDDRRKHQYFNPNTIEKDYFSNIIIPETGEPLVLFDHQVRVINALITAGNGVAIAATGAGKTIICAALAQQYNALGARVLIIVPSSDLITQTREELEFCNLETGEYSGSLKQYTEDATVVSTWQALSKNKSVISTGFDVVIVDECHGIKGNVLTELLNEHGAHIPHRIGVTGTLPKGETDAMAVRIAVGEVVERIDAHELIEAGILASLDIKVEQLEEDFKERYELYLEELTDPSQKLTYIKFKDTYFPDYSSEKAYLQKNENRRTWIGNRIQGIRHTGNTFVLVDSVAAGKKLAQEIPDSVFVHGADKKKARREIYDLFKDEDNLCIIATVHIASTGLNIKRIYNLVLVDIGKSFTRVIQSIGRGLRKAVDKDHVDVFDLCSDLKYSKKHLTDRKKYYKEAQYPFNVSKIDYVAQLSHELL